MGKANIGPQWVHNTLQLENVIMSEKVKISLEGFLVIVNFVIFLVNHEIDT